MPLGYATDKPGNIQSGSLGPTPEFLEGIYSNFLDLKEFENPFFDRKRRALDAAEDLVKKRFGKGLMDLDIKNYLPDESSPVPLRNQFKELQNRRERYDAAAAAANSYWFGGGGTFGSIEEAQKNAEFAEIIYKTKLLNYLKKVDGGGIFKGIPNAKQVLDEVNFERRKIHEYTSDVAARQSTLQNLGTGFAGSVLHSFINPIELSFNLLTGGQSSLLKSIAMGVTGNLLADVPGLARRYQIMKELNIDYGTDDAALELLFSAGLGALIPTGAAGLRRVRPYGSNALAYFRDNANAPRSLRRVADGLSKVQRINELNPFRLRRGDDGRAESINTARNVANALENDNPITDDLIEVRDSDIASERRRLSNIPEEERTPAEAALKEDLDTFEGAKISDQTGDIDTDSVGETRADGVREGRVVEIDEEGNGKIAGRDNDELFEFKGKEDLDLGDRVLFGPKKSQTGKAEASQIRRFEGVDVAKVTDEGNKGLQPKREKVSGEAKTRSEPSPEEINYEVPKRPSPVKAEEKIKTVNETNKYRESPEFFKTIEDNAQSIDDSLRLDITMTDGTVIRTGADLKDHIRRFKQFDEEVIKCYRGDE